MIERYTNPEMGNIWSEQAKYQTWLDVEIAACEANCKLGKIPLNAMETIRSQANFTPERMETTTKINEYHRRSKYHKTDFRQIGYPRVP